MSTFWQNVKSNLQDGLKTVTEKTDELTRIGRLKIQIIAVKRDIEKNFTDLGGRAYEILASSKKKMFEVDADIQSIVDEVKDLDKKLRELESKVEEIQNLKFEKQSDTDN